MPSEFDFHTPPPDQKNRRSKEAKRKGGLPFAKTAKGRPAGIIWYGT